MDVTSPDQASSGPSFGAIARAPRLAVTAAAVAAALIGIGLQTSQGQPARGGDPTTSAPAADAHAAFIAGIRRTLKADDLRLVALADRVLEAAGLPGSHEEQVERLRIDAMKAEGVYDQARRRVEIADLARKEFIEAVLPHELAAADAQLGIAKADLVRARLQARQANGEVGKITSALEEQKATFGIELAESHREVLRKYTQSQRTKELEARLTKARSEEWSTKAEWERLKARLETLQKSATAEPGRPGVSARILTLVDRAVPIEERAHAGLARLRTERNPRDADEKELRSWVDELEALIDEAEAIKASDDFARMKSRIHEAASRQPMTKSR